MTEYIEREAALQKVKKLQETDPAVIGKKQFADGYFVGLDELEVILRGISAAEVMKVVLCQNCGHHTTDTCPKDKVWCRRLSRYMDADGFCSYGERKE